MIRAPLELRRVTPSGETAALFVPGSDAGPVLAVLAELKLEPVPRLYRLTGGFLIRPDAPPGTAPAGIIRLRALGQNLFAPVDASLSPALLEDETRGLGPCVLLPGGSPRAFDPAKPLALSELLHFGAIRRPAFTPVGEPAARATEIRELILDRPEDDIEEMLRQSGRGIGEQQPDPEGESSLKGKAEFKAGRTIANLGKALGMDSLEKLGGRLMNKGLRDSPDQLQGLLGRQEAALRDLLRKFREGKIEEALRRALPVSETPGRGSREAGTANLPVHNLTYSLGNLLAGSAGGAANWFTEPDIYAALIAEYRKAADLAITDGDHRRAAFIYGKLLNDWRGAANVLGNAGLHHDAAVLYLQKLNDKPAAAKAFEAAGEIDEAVRLYRGIGRHVEAGDLLRRAGDEAAAAREYRAGAEQMAERSDFLAAAALLRDKTGDVQAGAEYLRRGWQSRGHAQIAACGVHLMVARADLQDADGVVEVLAEGERYFSAPGQESDAAAFFNMAATLARRDALGKHQAQLRDRALAGLAHKLRQRVARNDSGGSELMARSDAWSPAQVSDAAFALRAEVRKRKSAATHRTTESVVTTLRLCAGPVGPIAWAQAAGTLFVTDRNGAIRSFSPERGAAEVDIREGLPIRLAASDDGRYLVVQGSDVGAMTLSSYIRRDNGSWRLCRRAASTDQWLALAGSGREYLLATPLADGYRLLGVDSLAPRLEPGPAPAQAALDRPFLLRLQPREGPAGWLMLVFAARGAYLRWLQVQPAQWHACALHWQPNLALAGGVSVLRAGADSMEVAGLNEYGSLYWSRIEIAAQGTPRAESLVVAAQGDYLCATLCGPGRIAAVGRSQTMWFSRQGRNFAFKAAVKTATQQAVSCHFSDATRELIVLCADGTIQLVPAPV
jgi:tetratricopeptide (TPR) repeat protein